jgi:hypothetical protein
MLRLSVVGSSLQGAAIMTYSVFGVVQCLHPHFEIEESHGDAGSKCSAASYSSTASFSLLQLPRLG